MKTVKPWRVTLSVPLEINEVFLIAAPFQLSLHFTSLASLRASLRDVRHKGGRSARGKVLKLRMVARRHGACFHQKSARFVKKAARSGTNIIFAGERIGTGQCQTDITGARVTPCM